MYPGDETHSELFTVHTTTWNAGCSCSKLAYGPRRTHPIQVVAMAETRLCAKCQEIISAGIDPEAELPRQPHHTTRESFFQAVEQGCYICAWTWREHSWYKPDHEASAYFQSTKFSWTDQIVQDNQFVKSDGVVLQLRISMHAKGDILLRDSGFWLIESTIKGIHSYLSCGPSLTTADQYPGTIRTSWLNPSTRSEETLSLIKAWLRKCRSEHVQCRSTTSTRKLPTRLVCVQPTNTASKLTAKICRTDVIAAGRSYLALSHCWGDTKFLTTTRANLNAHEISLPVDRLSKTFQDALSLTLGLGMRYIWIDSLCIVQDDPDDWEHESRLMHEVYKNASCNLSASGFGDGAEGFMPQQRGIDSEPVPVTLRYQKPNSKSIVDAPADTYYLIHAAPWDDMRSSPIFLRAWTLQEQLLVRPLADIQVRAYPVDRLLA